MAAGTRAATCSLANRARFGQRHRKICFIAAQVVGATGKIIGIDMTDEMLEVARRNAPIVAERVGYANVEFRKGRIQDLRWTWRELDEELRRRPITDAASFLAADELPRTCA